MEGKAWIYVNDKDGDGVFDADVNGGKGYENLHRTQDHAPGHCAFISTTHEWWETQYCQNWSPALCALIL